MDRVELTHVSVAAIDLQRSIDWYADMFGADAVVREPSPTFIGPAAWLRIGHLSLHIAQWRDPSAREASRPGVNHFGIGVLDPDLFHSIYRKAVEQDAFDTRFGSHIFEIPSREVQMYLRDPGGNIVEVDFPDIALLDRTIIEAIPRLADVYSPQPDRAADGTLFRWLRQVRAQQESEA